MRILVVSLLRMGDLVMAANAIAGLKRKYPNAEIDLFTNDSNRGVVPLISAISRTYYFSRTSLQKDLGEAHRPIFAGIDSLKALVHEINRKEYDLLINLTQNKLSGYMCALIEAREKIGLVISENEQSTFGSTWFRHLNDFAHVQVPHLFHFVDIFKAAMGVSTQSSAEAMLNTEAGNNEISSLDTDRPILVIQPFTSDEKKNWRGSSWAEFIATFSRLQPGFDIHVFGAPNEKVRVQEIVDLAARRGAPAQATILSLEGAFALLRKSKLCVSVDTGIKHLAAAAGTQQIVELVLGSSDFKRTAAYSSNSLVIRSVESCQPCGHSTPCHRTELSEERPCATRVSPMSVASLTAQFFRRDQITLAAAATEYSDEVDCYLGRISAGGFWWPEKIGEGSGEVNSAYLLELFAWKMILEKEHLEIVAPFGAHVRHFRDSLNAGGISKFAIEQLIRNYSEKSGAIVRLQSDIVRLLKDNLSQGTKSKASLESEINSLEQQLDWKNFLLPRWRELNGHGLGQVRVIQRLLSDVEQLQQIRLKLLQSIRDLPQENL
jgi:ADP-heptose:LPS heptosyltransferase